MDVTSLGIRIRHTPSARHTTHGCRLSESARINRTSQNHIWWSAWCQPIWYDYDNSRGCNWGQMDIRHDPILQHKTPTQPFNLRRQKEVSGLKLKFLPDSRYTLPQGLRRHLEPCGEAVRKRCYPPGSTFRNNSVGNVTYVNAWANPPSVPVCLTNRFFH